MNSRVTGRRGSIRWKIKFRENKFLFFFISHYFNIVGRSFQMLRAATEKARFPTFSLVLEICCEVNDLSYLDILEGD